MVLENEKKDGPGGESYDMVQEDYNKMPEDNSMVLEDDNVWMDE